MPAFVFFFSLSRVGASLYHAIKEEFSPHLILVASYSYTYVQLLPSTSLHDSLARYGWSRSKNNAERMKTGNLHIFRMQQTSTHLYAYHCGAAMAAGAIVGLLSVGHRGGDGLGWIFWMLDFWGCTRNNN
jgi:hypothetical protein